MASFGSQAARVCFISRAARVVRGVFRSSNSVQLTVHELENFRKVSAARRTDHCSSTRYQILLRRDGNWVPADGRLHTVASQHRYFCPRWCKSCGIMRLQRVNNPRLEAWRINLDRRAAPRSRALLTINPVFIRPPCNKFPRDARMRLSRGCTAICRLSSRLIIVLRRSRRTMHRYTVPGKR